MSFAFNLNNHMALLGEKALIIANNVLFAFQKEDWSPIGFFFIASHQNWLETYFILTIYREVNLTYFFTFIHNYLLIYNIIRLKTLENQQHKLFKIWITIGKEARVNLAGKVTKVKVLPIDFNKVVIQEMLNLFLLLIVQLIIE